jgi:hypothetical protein
MSAETGEARFSVGPSGTQRAPPVDMAAPYLARILGKAAVCASKNRHTPVDVPANLTNRFAKCQP